MKFLSPTYLWLLLGVAALAAAYLFLQARRRHVSVRFTNVALLDSIAPKRPGWRRHLPAAVVLLGVIGLIVGLAAPVRNQRVPRDEAIVMLVVDVSASMQATDVSPNRLEAATSAAETFVTDLPAKLQVGLVAFDRTTQVLATPTTDHASVIASLEALRTGPGTATGDALTTAVDAITAALAAANVGTPTTAPRGSGAESGSAAVPATIVLLSDGAATVGTPVQEGAQAAADKGIPVTTIAYGTAEGTVDVNGQPVPVPSDPATMQQIAQTTGGTAFTAASATQLRQVYQDIQARVGYRTEQHDIQRWFFVLGLVLVVLAVVGSLVWTARFL
jgi:Ca-activated chloride channel family protein